MKHAFLRRPALAAATALMLMSAGVAAHADDVANNLDTTVDATYETMALTVGGSAMSTKLYTVTRNGDGKNGCNLTGGTSLKVAVSSSDPSVATVSPAEVTFTSCVNEANTPHVLWVTPLAPGTTTVTLSQVSNTTAGTFELRTASFTVNVAPPPNTAPSIEVTGVTGGAAYEFGAVPAASCSVTDAEDGSKSFPATLGAITGPLAAHGLGEQEATCSYTDTGGLTATAAATYSIVDTTAPVIAFESRTPANGNGWNNTDVDVEWSCTDNVAVDAAASTLSRTVSAEGADQSATGTCTDVAGNEASDTQVGINVDKTAPSITWNGGPADGGSYHFGSVPGAPTCDATDDLSGVDGVCSVSGYAGSVGSHELTATATDRAGNVADDTRTYEVKAWTLKGFHQPVDMSGVYNVVKGGSTVPLKFEVFKGDEELTDTTAIKHFTQTRVACQSGTAEDAVEELVTTGGTSLRYDPTAGQFIQNWKTPKDAGKCYQVTMTTQDDSKVTALFKLK